MTTLEKKLGIVRFIKKIFSGKKSVGIKISEKKAFFLRGLTQKVKL